MTRSLTVSDRAISNVLVLGRESNVAQPESDPSVIMSTRIARASRELQFDAQQRKAALALIRQQQNLDDSVHI